MADPPAAFRGIPVPLRVSVGTARPTLSELTRLGPDDVLTLDRAIEDPVELYAGDRLVARGELVEIDSARPGRLGLRITEIVEGADAV